MLCNIDFFDRIINKIMATDSSPRIQPRFEIIDIHRVHGLKFVLLTRRSSLILAFIIINLFVIKLLRSVLDNILRQGSVKLIDFLLLVYELLQQVMFGCKTFA